MIKIHYEVSSVYYSIQEVPLHKISRENVRVLSKIREKREVLYHGTFVVYGILSIFSNSYLVEVVD